MLGQLVLCKVAWGDDELASLFFDEAGNVVNVLGPLGQGVVGAEGDGVEGAFVQTNLETVTGVAHCFFHFGHVRKNVAVLQKFELSVIMYVVSLIG